MSSYREILMGSHVAKTHHAFLRGKLLQATGHLLHEMMMGGLQKRGVPGKWVHSAALVDRLARCLLQRAESTPHPARPGQGC
eukprot:4882593-Pyramimonas_sp.AAC.1